MKPPIVLLTDFGLTDPFVGVMKGVILKITPRVPLVDLSHGITPQDISQGSLVLKTSYTYFPPQTIFVTVIDPGVGSKRKAIILKTKNYTFVAPDNGILYPIFISNASSCIYEIKNDQFFLNPVSHTFQGRDVFAPVAAYLSKRVSPKSFGPRILHLKKLTWPHPWIKSKTLLGEIIAIDRFGNLMTNIEARHLAGTPTKLTIYFRNKTIRGLRTSYAEVKKGKLLAILGSMGFLEIATNQGSAQAILKAKIGDQIKIVK